jgi:hypothetical protein
MKAKNVTDLAITVIAIALICLILSQHAINSPVFPTGEKSHKKGKPSASPLPSPTRSRPMMVSPDTLIFTDPGILTR